jgi:hypothetical protein
MLGLLGNPLAWFLEGGDDLGAPWLAFSDKTQEAFQFNARKGGPTLLFGGG